MPTIPIPFIISSNGIGDSLFKTLGLWVILFGVIVVIGVIYGLFAGDISLPRMNITAGRILGALVIAVVGAVAFQINPLLLLPLLFVVLVVLVYREVNAKKPDPDPGFPYQESPPRERPYRPRTDEGMVIDAEFHVVQEPVKKNSPARPVKAERTPETAAQKEAEEHRLHYEEQKKREQEEKLRARELGRQQDIHGLYSDRFHDYLLEAETFRKEFGKNVQCDICGRWDRELFVHRNQTYCQQCLPPGSRQGPDRTVVAGKHGASIDHLKK
jgi:hypothetical protein